MLKKFAQTIGTLVREIEKWYTPLVNLPDKKLTKADIFHYYLSPEVNKRLLEDLAGHNVIVIQHFQPDYPVLKRNEQGKRIKIESFKNFEHPNDLGYWIRRRATEFHKVLGEQTNMYVIDIDPNEVDLETTKKVVKDVKDILSRLPEVSNVEIRFSGGRGFYVIGYLNKKMNINEARERLKELLKPLTANPMLTLSVPAKGQIRLDLSPMKKGGSFRALYSLNTSTGFISVPVKNIDSFNPYVHANPFRP
jgi:DNA primase